MALRRLLTLIAGIQQEAPAADAVLLPAAAVFASEFDAGDSGSAKTIDFAGGQKQRVRLTADATLTLASPPGVGHYQLRIIQDGTGGRTLSIVPASGTIGWVGAALQPSHNLTPNGRTVLNAYWNGSAWSEVGMAPVGVPAGAALLPSAVHAMVTSTTNQSLTNNVEQPIVYQRVDLDPYGMFNPSNPSRLTMPFDGIVQLTLNASFSSSTSGQRRVYAWKNGTTDTYPGIPVLSCAPGDATASLTVTSGLLEVVAGDYFEAQAWANATGISTSTGSDHMYFTAQYLRID